MPEDPTPTDVLADIEKLIGGPAQDGHSNDSGDQPASEGANDLAEFQDNPTDAPDVAQLKRELRATMTRRTTEIAAERKRIKEQAQSYEQDRRDAEMFRALKSAQDPEAAAKAMVGNRQSPNGIVDPDAVLQKHKETFDAPTYEGIEAIARAVWLQEAKRNLSPYQQAIESMIGERHQGEQAKVISEYGDDASQWIESAKAIQQRTGLSLKDAILVASEGKVALSKIKATVADARKRAATPPSVAPNSVTAQRKIGLTRDERTAIIKAAAARAAAAGVPGVDRFAHD